MNKPIKPVLLVLPEVPDKKKVGQGQINRYAKRKKKFDSINADRMVEHNLEVEKYEKSKVTKKKAVTKKKKRTSEDVV